MKHIVALRVRETTGHARQNEPLVWGVPLRAGIAHDSDALVLRDERGRALATQAEFLARWPDGSGKWALMTVPAFSMAAGQRRRLTLAHGRVRRSSALVVRETPAGVFVNSGALRFTVHRRGLLVPAIEVRRGRFWQTRATGLDLAMSVAHGGTAASYLASRHTRDVQVESLGSLRAVVTVHGTHESETGRSFGPYILRMEVIAGSFHLRLTHSFLYDANPEQDFVRASEVILRTDVGEAQRFGFGGDEGHEVRFPRQRAPVWTPDFRYAELFQDSATHWRIRRWVDLDRREVFCEEGLRADGWMELSGRKGRLAVAVREFWQNHPKALFADAGTGELRIGLYPARAERLDLRRYSDLVYPQTYETPSYRSVSPLPFNSKRYNARGIRKTHDLLLMFDEPNPSRAALAYNHPLRLEWTPAYMARTRVIVPATPRLEKRWFKHVNSYLDFLATAMLRDGGTGYVDYFDLPHSFDLAQGRWFHDHGGLAYCNDELLPCLGLWQAYFLTGREDAFVMARAMTRHVMDMDCHYTGPAAGFGSRHNINHWGDQCNEQRISQPMGKRFLHYLTGDREALDLTKVMLEVNARRFVPPRRTNLTCDAPAVLASLLFAEETGLTDAHRWLVGFADALAGSIDDMGRMRAFLEIDSAAQTARPVPEAAPIRQMMFSSFGGPQAFMELAERLDHSALRAALVRFLYYQLLPGRRREAFEKLEPAARSDHWATFAAADLMAYVWTLTGDRNLIARARRYLARPRVRIDGRSEPRYGVPGAARRQVIVSDPWLDAPRQAKSFFKKHHPLFTPESVAQFTGIANCLHKMQGIMLLTLAKEHPG